MIFSIDKMDQVISHERSWGFLNQVTAMNCKIVIKVSDKLNAKLLMSIEARE